MLTDDYPYKLRIGETLYVTPSGTSSRIAGQITGLSNRCAQVQGEWYEQRIITPNPYMADLYWQYDQTGVSSTPENDKKVKHLIRLMYNLMEIELHLGMRENPENKFVASKENNG